SPPPLHPFPTRRSSDLLILDECGEQFADKVHVVRAGVDTRLFAPTAGGPLFPAPDDERRLRILCIGTLLEVKGQTYLVEACRLRSEEHTSELQSPYDLV